ncbi:MAG: hypothetical protein ACIALR_09505 [Blastopirellula sp. JB062]
MKFRVSGQYKNGKWYHGTIEAANNQAVHEFAKEAGITLTSVKEEFDLIKKAPFPLFVFGVVSLVLSAICILAFWVERTNGDTSASCMMGAIFCLSAASVSWSISSVLYCAGRIITAIKSR